MTSYATANETTTSSSSPPPSGATNASSDPQQLQQEQNSTNYAATTTKGIDEEQEHQYHNQDMQENPHIQQDFSDCECDSLSDGKEKADMTPENIKKIDDIIELKLEMERSKWQQQHHQQQQQQQQRNDASIAATISTAASVPENLLALNINESDSVGYSGLNVGDDSNEIFFSKKHPALCTEKEARLMEKSKNASGNSQQIESRNQSLSDTIYETTPIELIDDIIESAVTFDDSLTEANRNKTRRKIKATTAQEESETETETETDGGNSKRSCAFTLTFDNNDENAAAATAARYKSVMERFQSRHRRGASMSKLDSENSGVDNATTTMTSSLTGDGLSINGSSFASPITLRSIAKSQQKPPIDVASSAAVAAAGEESTVAHVKLRPRDRSTSRVRDAVKRHSWSPRSSTSELSVAPTTTPAQAATRQAQQRPPTSARRSIVTVKTKPPPPPVLPKGGANLLANRTQQFTPRSTAMQLALQKIDFLCAQSPLGDFQRSGCDDGDDVSETGTYTLDGDNYTEEQKDLMNIDKNLRGGRKQRKHDRNHHHHQQQQQQRSEQRDEFVCGGGGGDATGDGASATITTKIPVRTSNVLEVNYFHNEADECGIPKNDEYYASPPPPPRLKSSKKAQSDFLLGNHGSAGAYLEQIKSRVLRKHTETTVHPTMTTHDDDDDDDEDVGCFTSVTTSGVLAKQGALDPCPKLSLLRKNSLTTSQIDSSEYVSNEAKLKSAPSGNHGGSYTDIQKAEYRLNLFTNQKDMHKYAATRNLIETPPETPVVTTDRLPSDTAALTMAQTKNDWIQQWARNARARSLASDTCIEKQQQHQQQQQQQQKSNAMAHSYNCGGTSSSVAGGSLTDDSLYCHQLNEIAHYRGNDHEFDYSSDPSLLTSIAYAKSQAQAQAQDSNGNASVKPPKSPSKIPSPLHSIGRTRSASRTRGSLQGLMTTTTTTTTTQDLGLDDDGQDIYLQKTAAAINSLQQSLSRKNSLKSPPGSSPRMTMNKSSRSHQLSLQSNDDGDSPQRSIDSDGYHRSNRHRRNMSNESATQSQTQAQLMTSSFNEQQLKLLTSGEYLIKQMRMRKNSFDGNICSPSRRRMDQPLDNSNSAISPLHRSKASNANHQQRTMSARSQLQNVYNTPASRQPYGPLTQMFPNQHQHQQLMNSHQQQLMKKSASSNNFGQAYNDYDDNLEYYINDADDDDDGDADLSLEHEDAYGNGDGDELEYGEYEYSDANEGYGPRTITLQAATIDDAPATAPLTSTRYNKALLMRIERNKQRAAAAGSKPTSARSVSKSSLTNVASLIGCPNTPEMPRRNVKSAPRSGVSSSARQSVPREASLSRLASQVPNSLASAKRQLLQTAAAANQRSTVQPKYLDISKYKPAQGNAFLRKNEAKSTLKVTSSSGDAIGGIRRSPSSSGLSRNDPSRASNRSIRSAMISSCSGSIGGGGTSSGNNSGNVQRAFSAVRRDDSASKQKEIEMAMWKRRSTYDPLKAAAEDRRRKEEAKRLAVVKNSNDVPCESTNVTSNDDQ